MEDNQFDKQLRDRFRNQTIRPSDSVWSEIEAGLQTPPNPWYKRNLLWISFLILGVSLGIYLNSDIQGTNTTIEVVPPHESVFENLEKESHASVLSDDEQNIETAETSTNTTNQVMDEPISRHTTKPTVHQKSKHEKNPPLIENKSSLKGVNIAEMVNLENTANAQTSEEPTSTKEELPAALKNDYVSAVNESREEITYPKVKITLDHRKVIKINPDALRYGEEDTKSNSFISKVLKTVNTTGQEALYAISTRNLDKSFQ